MKFTKHYTVMWHDTDGKREVRPSKILAYMQETANYQCMNAGLSLDELRDQKGLAFLLSRITLRLYRPLYAYDEIDVETWICDGRGLRFNRCFRILRAGEIVAEGYSVWALLDLNSKKLLRSEAFPYDIQPDQPLEGLADRVRFPSPTLLHEAGRRKIVYSDIDYNGHMNNTHYPDMLCDFLPDANAVRVVGMSLSFLHEAALGHTLTVYRYEENGNFYFRTAAEDGTACLEAVLFTEALENLDN